MGLEIFAYLAISSSGYCSRKQPIICLIFQAKNYLRFRVLLLLHFCVLFLHILKNPCIQLVERAKIFRKKGASVCDPHEIWYQKVTPAFNSLQLHACYFFPSPTQKRCGFGKPKAYLYFGLAGLPGGGNSFQLMVILLTTFKHATSKWKFVCESALVCFGWEPRPHVNIYLSPLLGKLSWFSLTNSATNGTYTHSLGLWKYRIMIIEKSVKVELLLRVVTCFEADMLHLTWIWPIKNGTLKSPL